MCIFTQRIGPSITCLNENLESFEREINEKVLHIELPNTGLYILDPNLSELCDQVDKIEIFKITSYLRRYLNFINVYYIIKLIRIHLRKGHAFY